MSHYHLPEEAKTIAQIIALSLADKDFRSKLEKNAAATLRAYGFILSEESLQDLPRLIEDVEKYLKERHKGLVTS